MSCNHLVLALLAALLAPLAVHAQDSTSGDDARPMTQRICDKSPGSCAEMQSRHELCQKHPEECQGTKTDNAEAHDRAASVPERPSHPGVAATARQRAHPHRRHQAAAKAGAAAPAVEPAKDSVCQANPKGCPR